MIVYGLVARDGADALVELGGVVRAAALAQRVERDRVADVAGRVDHDDRLERGQVVADLADLRDLRGVLADDRARLGVARHPLALLGGVGRVDRHDDGARGRDAEVRVRPLGTGGAEDRDAVARGDAEVDQPAADLRDDLAELGVADVVPAAVTLEADRRMVAVPLGRKPDQVGDRRRPGGPFVNRHRGAALHGSSSRSQRKPILCARVLPRRASHAASDGYCAWRVTQVRRPVRTCWPGTGSCRCGPGRWGRPSPCTSR